MATGKKAFEGSSQASLIAAIMEKDPRPMAELQPMTPATLDHVVRRCMSKEPDRRWQTAADLMEELKWVTGDAVPVLEGVRGVSRVGSSDYSISRDGTLVYVSRTDREEENSLVWVDREGKESPVTSEKNAYLHPRISPDGK
ncbi:hypothetical protein MYX82_14570, partial [Acidobacteria bacterium AH-259-D05]|nr:hypothetical protein [Acidobacteria bacterium AH-259-D05]